MYVAINCSQYRIHNDTILRELPTYRQRHGHTMMTDKSYGEEELKFISNKLNWMLKKTHTRERARGHSHEVSFMFTE